MAKIMKYHHGVRFTSKVLVDTNELSRGYSGTGDGKQTFSLSLKIWDDGKDGQERDESTNYELQLSRKEVEETIKRWQGYLAQYPAEHVK